MRSVLGGARSRVCLYVVGVSALYTPTHRLTYMLPPPLVREYRSVCVRVARTEFMMCILAISKLTLACFMECEWGMRLRARLPQLIYMARVSAHTRTYVCVCVQRARSWWLMHSISGGKPRSAPKCSRLCSRAFQLVCNNVKWLYIMRCDALCAFGVYESIPTHRKTRWSHIELDYFM